MYQPEISPLQPGLYLVATPIGTAKDITLRALDTLASADVIAAEDTRTARKLMDIHGIALRGRPLLAYHDHNGQQARPVLLEHVRAGRSVAYVSEAGSPLIADPGYHLAFEMRANGFGVVSVPGPSAVVAALSVGGLPTDCFVFAGFPPNSPGARRKFLTRFTEAPGTLVFYESPKRIVSSLADMMTVFGADRRAAICRELTKKFEEVIDGSLQELSEILSARTLKGEIVVLVARAEAKPENTDPRAELELALRQFRTREAAAHVAEKLGLPRRDVYQIALEMQRKDDG